MFFNLGLNWALSCISVALSIISGFLGGSDGKESACQCRRLRFNPWAGRSPGEGNGNPLQDSWGFPEMSRKTWNTWHWGLALKTLVPDAVWEAVCVVPTAWSLAHQHHLVKFRFSGSTQTLNQRMGPRNLLFNKLGSGAHHSLGSSGAVESNQRLWSQAWEGQLHPSFN